MTKRTKKRVVTAAILLGGALVLALPALIRVFVLEAFKIPAGSMMPTLFVGDHIFVTKSAYGTGGPPRGDAIVFAFPEDERQDFIKRVIGGPGDTITMKAGRPTINGWSIPSCSLGPAELPREDGTSAGEMVVEFLEGAAYLAFYEADSTMPEPGPWIVPADHYFVMGDHRNNSFDSRMWFGGKGGTVPRANVRGRAAFVWLAPYRGGIDWERNGTSLGEPRLPRWMPETLHAKLRECLAKRPARAAATPPKPH